MPVENRGTIFLNIDDSILISVAKLNIFMESVESGLQSLVHGLLKVSYGVGAAITAEVGNRDLAFMLLSLAHELQPDTEFELLLKELLPKISDMRGKRNALVHSHLMVDSSKRVISWSRVTAKGEVMHRFSKITFDELSDLLQEAQNLASDVMVLHGKLGAVW